MKGKQSGKCWLEACSTDDLITERKFPAICSELSKYIAAGLDKLKHQETARRCKELSTLFEKRFATEQVREDWLYSYLKPVCKPRINEGKQNI